MADEVKPKRPVPPQFLKKKEKVADVANATSEQLPAPPAEIFVPVFLVEDSHKVAVVKELTIDLMNNRYFQILEKEARPLAERMLNEGSESLHDVKWFLAYSERVQLAKELKEKYGLLK